MAGLWCSGKPGALPKSPTNAPQMLSILLFLSGELQLTNCAMTVLQSKQMSLKSQCEASRSVLTGDQTRLPEMFMEGFKSLPF